MMGMGDVTSHRRRCASRASVAAGLALLMSVGFSVALDSAQNEIDTFMDEVLQRRDENWVRSHEYVLDEREVFRVVGPGGFSLRRVDREYSWFVRDGHLIRSPRRFNGVEISESERRSFEADWLRQERRRAENPGRGLGGRRRSTRDAFDNIMITIEREWGQRATDELGRSLAEDATLWRDDEAAVVAGTDRIVADLGGVEQVGWGRVVSKTRDAFVLLEAGRLGRAQVARLLSVMIPVLADAAAGATDVEIEAFVELMQLAARTELRIPDVEPALSQAHRALLERGAEASAQILAVVQAELVEIGTEPMTDVDAGGHQLSVGAGAQSRFVSEAYFLDFEFEPGHYYFAGRDEVAGREVVKIEYYPEHLFSDADDAGDDDRREDRIDAGFDKTSLVTLWIDEDERQIVKFTFGNVGFDFLPMRWLVRLDDLTASMVMGQPFEDVWLPETVEIHGQLTLATGTVTVAYSRSFSNYRQAEVRARIRTYGTP